MTYVKTLSHAALVVMKVRTIIAFKITWDKIERAATRTAVVIVTYSRPSVGTIRHCRMETFLLAFEEQTIENRNNNHNKEDHVESTRVVLIHYLYPRLFAQSFSG